MLPKSETKSFTLAIDGKLMRKLNMPSVEAAESLAVGLAESGHRVEVIDWAMGDVVKTLGTAQSRKPNPRRSPEP